MSEIILQANNIEVSAPIFSFKSLKELFSESLKQRQIVDKKKLLTDVSFSIYEGDSIALLGSNGAGKTTLSRVLAGIIYPEKGHILTPYQVRYLSDQLPEIDNNLSGVINAKYLSRIIYPHYQSLKDFDKKLSQAFEFSGLKDYLLRPIRTYSYGMKKRLMTSIQTMYSSDILIMDEFSIGTDKFFEQMFMDRMQDLFKQTKATIWINHSEDFLSQNCNRAILLDRGQVVLDSDLSTCSQAYERVTDEG